MRNPLSKVIRFFLLLGVLTFVGCREAKQLSSSMAPSIQPGEKVTINYTAYAVSTPKRWDVVAFEPPGRTNGIWVMRVIALSGESVAFSSGGITVSGEVLSPPGHITNVAYLSLDQIDQIGITSSVSSPYLVPPNSFFVLGDNSADANDSRFWGAVPRTNILGQVRGK
jgi:signal peptidase I